jgi:hypothetical protein
MIKARLSPEASTVPCLPLGKPTIGEQVPAVPPELLGPGVFVVPTPLPEPLPRLVRMFWDFEEADTPPWRRETDSDRAVRQYLEARGCWPG